MDDGDLFLDGDVFPRFLRHAFHGRRVSVPRDLLLLLLLLLSDLQLINSSVVIYSGSHFKGSFTRSEIDIAFRWLVRKFTVRHRSKEIFASAFAYS